MKAREAAGIAGLYALFAAASTGLNLGVQWAVSALWPWRLVTIAALCAGTGAGLLLKYVLDRRWIFPMRSPGLRGDVRRFILYAGTGVATTALFWGTELAFLAVFAVPWAKYAGGAIGLCAGYTAKYALDRRFVFRRRAPGEASEKETQTEK